MPDRSGPSSPSRPFVVPCLRFRSFPLPALHVLKLGRISYQHALDIQVRLADSLKDSDTLDAFLLLLEHEPVITVEVTASNARCSVSGNVRSLSLLWLSSETPRWCQPISRTA